MFRLLVLPLFTEYSYTKEVDIGLYDVKAYRRR